MDRAALIWHADLADYDFGPAHPLNPVRLRLTVELIDALQFLSPDDVLAPHRAPETDLLRVHTAGYVEAVRHAGDWGSDFRPSMGLGTPDVPTFPGMHEAASLTCGATTLAIEEVVTGRRPTTFSVAGGMHHAHASRAAGFCVYNDAAVGICVARAKHPGLRVLYVDIDGHHGDGVQEAFDDSAEVMTISMHESGLYAFPGTGFPDEIGHGAGRGFAANIPLPAYATDECFALAFEQVVVPLARAFAPDVIVAQLGIDTHHSDPLLNLGLTLPGYRSLVRGIVGLAGEVCGGRLVALGGGGYRIYDVVPLAWAWVMAELSGVELTDRVPESWRDRVSALSGTDAPLSMGETDRFDSPKERAVAVRELTERNVAMTRAEVFPFHGLTP